MKLFFQHTDNVSLNQREKSAMIKLTTLSTSRWKPVKICDYRYRNSETSSHTVVVESLTFKFEFKQHDIIILIDTYTNVWSTFKYDQLSSTAPFHSGEVIIFCFWWIKPPPKVGLCLFILQLHSNHWPKLVHFFWLLCQTMINTAVLKEDGPDSECWSD